MQACRISWFLLGLLFLAALGLGYQAKVASSEATVLVEWSTATEMDTAGFNLFRSEKPDGPFDQINQQFIPAAGDPFTGGDYSYTDTQVEAGKTYFYMLEDVETSGATTSHGPIQVKAESGTRLEMVAAMVLLACGIIGVVIMGFQEVQKFDRT